MVPNTYYLSWFSFILRLVDGKTVSKTTNFSTELRVHNLDLKTKFQFSVRAKNTVGEGPPVMADFDLATSKMFFLKKISTKLSISLI